jgi:uncharacterized protein (TIGR03083 family)
MSTPSSHLQDNDFRFMTFARGLSEADWTRPSLCTEWTNHEVLAHLVIGYRTAPGALAGAIIRDRGSFDRANARLARALAAQRDPAELMDEFSALAQAPRGLARIFPRRLLLGDHVIHQLDIAYGLGKDSTIGAEALFAVLDTQVRVPNPFVPAAARARGLTLRATDIGWVHGNKGPLKGPLVTGTAADLASVLAGRPHALRRLRGDGLATLQSRLSGIPPGGEHAKRA